MCFALIFSPTFHNPVPSHSFPVTKNNQSSMPAEEQQEPRIIYMQDTEVGAFHRSRRFRHRQTHIFEVSQTADLLARKITKGSFSFARYSCPAVRHPYGNMCHLAINKMAVTESCSGAKAKTYRVMLRSNPFQRAPLPLPPHIRC